MLIFILIVLAIALFFVCWRDSKQKHQNPVFYSAWIMPIYTYFSSLNDVRPYYQPLLLTATFLLICFGWAICTTFMVSPSHIGVSFTCIVECMFFVIAFWTNTYAYRQHVSVKGYVDKIIVKQAWL